MSEVKPEVEALAKLLKPGIKVGKDGICEVDPDLYEKTLEGTNLTMEQETAAQKHKTAVAAAFSLAVGEVGLAAMKKDKNLELVDAEMNIGKDTLGVLFEKSRDVRDPAASAEKGETVTKTVYGGLSTRYTVNGSSTNRGQVKVVKDLLRSRASEAFGS